MSANELQAYDATLIPAEHRTPDLPEIVPEKLTAADMRISEVNALLRPAYEKAATLELTDKEREALTEPFDDRDVEKRAHDGLYYIPHILVSDRLTKIFGPGKWTMVRRWERMEPGKNYKGQPNATIYAEWVMIIRGVYIGESVGAHTYETSNAKSNYSDSLEATRGEALRRIAGKYLGCGSQVWSPAYCRELDERRAAPAQRPAQQTTQAVTTTKPAEQKQEPQRVTDFREFRAKQLSRIPEGYFADDATGVEWWVSGCKRMVKSLEIKNGNIVTMKPDDYERFTRSMEAAVSDLLLSLKAESEALAESGAE